MGEESSSAVIGKMKEDCDKKENRPDDKKNAGRDKEIKQTLEKSFIHILYFLPNMLSPQYFYRTLFQLFF